MLLRLLLLLLALSFPVSAAKIHNHNLEWAVVDGVLYARQGDSKFSGLPERADTTLYSLLAVTRGRQVANHRAFIRLGDHGSGPPFSFWRKPEASNIYLLPDYDYFGEADSWIPPLPFVQQALGAAAPAWTRRTDAVYFTGSHLGAVREQYDACAQADPAGRVRGDFISWSHLGRGGGDGTGGDSAAAWPFRGAGGLAAHLKPLEGDLRKLTAFKFLIYMSGHSWSTSMQRLLAAGAAVFLPKPVRHETALLRRLAACPDCFFYYDEEDVCGSLLAVLANITDESARGVATRLASFAKTHLTLEGTLDYLRDQLNAYAAAAVDGSKYPILVNGTFAVHREAGGDVLQLEDGTQLPEWTCAKLMASVRPLAGLRAAR